MNAGSAAAAEADAHRVIPPRRGVTPQPTDSVTIMRCARHQRATKIVEGIDGRKYQHCRLRRRQASRSPVRPVASIEELAAALDDTSKDPRAFALRGEPLPGVDAERCRRLLHRHEDGSPADIPRGAPAVGGLDFDNVPGPYRFDPRDGELAGIYCRSPSARAMAALLVLVGAVARPASSRACGSSWPSGSTGQSSGAELERHLKGCPIDPAPCARATDLCRPADPRRRR